MLMNLRPQCPCNRQMFPCIQDKLSLFQGCHLVHIDDAVPVAAYELGIAEQQAGKIVKTHVSPHKPVLQMDLDVMVAVIRICLLYTSTKRQSLPRAAYRSGT